MDNDNYDEAQVAKHICSQSKETQCSPPIITVINNDLITLREAHFDIHENRHQQFDDDLCSLKSFEQKEFAEWFEAPQNHATNKNIVFQNIDDYEVVFARKNFDPDQTENLNPDEINQIFQLRQSTPIPEDELVTVEEPPPIQCGQIMLTNVEAAPLVKTKKRSEKHVDKEIYIGDRRFGNQITHSVNTLRVLDPRDDHTNVTLIPFNQDLFQRPASRFNSIKLQKQFRRNLLTRTTAEDDELLGYLEVFDSERYHVDRFNKEINVDPVLPAGINMEIDEEIDLPKEQPPVPLLLEDQTASYGMEHIIPTASVVNQPIEINISIAVFDSTTKESLENPSNSMKKNKPDPNCTMDVGCDAILKILNKLWKNFVHPVGLKELSRGIPSKKHRAKIFFNLLSNYTFSIKKNLTK